MARRPKQTEIPGTERPNKIAEVDTAAEAYVDARDRRMKHTDKEVEAKEALIAVMKKHGLSVYEDKDANLIVTLSSKDAVKVTEAEEDGAEDEAA